MGAGHRGTHGGRALKLALWTPAPAARGLRARLEHLDREAEVEVIDAPPAHRVVADVHLYHLAGDPAHGFVLRALLATPGVVLLEEWDLHRLVLAETSGRGVGRALRSAARRAKGDDGTFIASLLERGTAGEWLALLLPLVEPALDAALAVAAFTRESAERVAALRPALPLALVPLPLLAAEPPPDRREARRELGIGDGRPLVVVLPPRGSLQRERLGAALAPLRADARLDVRDAPVADGAARTRLVASADVLVALEHPSRGRLDPALGTALRAGVATLVTAGSTAARELPEGVVASVSPGETEAAELVALVRRLAADPDLRERMGVLARAHAAAEADPRRAAERLLGLARAAAEAPLPARAAVRSSTPAGAALDEAGWIARSAGIAGTPTDVAALVAELFAPR